MELSSAAVSPIPDQADQSAAQQQERPGFRDVDQLALCWNSCKGNWIHHKNTVILSTGCLLCDL